MSTTTTHSDGNDVAILARFLGNGDEPLPRNLARYILDLTISDRDKARMHELAMRNQDDALTADEKAEMHAFGRAATVMSILKSKARRTLGVKLKARTVS
jgi:hypothetical protein